VLKKKNLEAAGGAESGAAALADIMATLSTGMDVYPLALGALVDAPAEWNFYKPLPEGKFLELVDSIASAGLITPLLVWEREPGVYTILSGHNRARALALLFEKTGDARYLTVHCLIKRAAELTPEDAQALLIDANWCQRTLSPSERAKSIVRKYALAGRGARGGGRTYDVIAQQYDLHATQVYQYMQLAQLESAWLARLDAGALSVKAAVHLAKMSAATRGTSPSTA